VERAQKKAELLVTVATLSRGIDCSEEQIDRVDRLAQACEAINPVPEPLESELVNGKWRLIYTTSQEILGASKPKYLRPTGPIYQTIDANALKAKNQETFPLFNAVEANLTPKSKSEVDVQFSFFRIFGLIPVKAPASAKGELEITYLDEDMRISRGNKGNLFVLLMEDPQATL